MNQDPRWSECHVEWDGADTVAKITHIPTGVYIEPKVCVMRNGVDVRDEMLEQLFSSVPKT